MRKTDFQFLKKSLLLLILSVFFKFSYAQQEVTVQGIVRDTVGGLPGVSVKIAGTNQGGQTDGLGRFKISAPSNAVLTFTFIGLKTKQVSLSNRAIEADGIINLNVLLEVDEATLEEVTVTGFGNTQKKASLVSSITSVNVKDLKGTTANLTNALAGKVAGIIAYQNSGEPGIGTDNSTFYIRGLSTFGTGKRDPLILIDGVESSSTDMARLQPDDI